METPCRYVEAFNEATSHLESRLESLLAKNFSELEEKRRILAQLEKSEPERVKVKERLSWLLHQEAKLQEALAEGTTCSRCKVLPNAATKVFVSVQTHQIRLQNSDYKEKFKTSCSIIWRLSTPLYCDLVPKKRHFEKGHCR